MGSVAGTAPCLPPSLACGMPAITVSWPHLLCSIDFKIKKVLIDGKWVKLQIWDTVRAGSGGARAG